PSYGIRRWYPENRCRRYFVMPVSWSVLQMAAQSALDVSMLFHSRSRMPRKRPPREVWIANIRPPIWKRDGGRCVGCKVSVALDKAHIDHIQSGKRGTNEFKNLRTLCRRCHVLRADLRHAGMIATTAITLPDGGPDI